ncbi:MAG: EcsC family protein [Oligoflexales bacterium]|nr:EcsC family protein [Oligoflexales bacterium]
MVLKLSRLVGKPIEAAQQVMPPKVQSLVNTSVQESLIFSLKTMLKTVPSVSKDARGFIQSSKKTKSFHTILAGLSGGVGGFFGVIALPVELPASTCIMLRSITKIAKECGEDFSDPKTLLECVAIFSYGEHKSDDDDTDFNSMYFAQRLAYSKLINDAAKYLATHSASHLLSAKKDLAPVLITFIAKVASIFKISISKKIVAESVPIIGSIGGSAINSLFSEHYSSVARYHFGIRSLERKYGKNRIKTIYDGFGRKQSIEAS